MCTETKDSFDDLSNYDTIGECVLNSNKDVWGETLDSCVVRALGVLSQPLIPACLSAGSLPSSCRPQVGFSVRFLGWISPCFLSSPKRKKWFCESGLEWGGSENIWGHWVRHTPSNAVWQHGAEWRLMRGYELPLAKACRATLELRWHHTCRAPFIFSARAPSLPPLQHFHLQAAQKIPSETLICLLPTHVTPSYGESEVPGGSFWKSSRMDVTCHWSWKEQLLISDGAFRRPPLLHTISWYEGHCQYPSAVRAWGLLSVMLGCSTAPSSWALRAATCMADFMRIRDIQQSNVAVPILAFSLCRSWPF